MMPSDFWSKVDKRGSDDCWLWLGKTQGHGYGYFWSSNKTVLTHRFCYELVKGLIPRGDNFTDHCVLHTCDNPPCVNPNHLFLGTAQDNSDDKVNKGRQAQGEQLSALWRGELGAHTKLTEDEVRKIFQDPDLHRMIAVKYGIGRSQVTRIKSGQTWKHLKLILAKNGVE